MEDFKFVVPLLVDATVSPVETEAEYDLLAAALIDNEEHILSTAGIDDISSKLLAADRAPIVGGRPRMLHIQAIIAHEGVNGNGDGFYADDLRKAVMEKKLFHDGFGGMIDINHNFYPIGYWYDASIVTDPVTNTVSILAKGAIWAWRFAEEVDTILANQHRDGKISVSMSCVVAREDLEIKQDEMGRSSVYHKNPVFIATTILNDVPPGDVNARGHADEDPKQLTETELRDLVLKAAQQIVSNQIKVEEPEMLDELKPMLEEKLGEQSERVINAFKAEMKTVTDQLTDKDTLLTEANVTIESLTATVAEKDTTIEEKNLAMENLLATVETLTAARDEMQQKLDAYAAVELVAQAEALKQARLAEVSDAVRTKLAAKSEEVQKAITDRWASQSEEEWEVTKAEHALALEAQKGGEGFLPGGANGSGEVGLDRFIK